MTINQILSSTEHRTRPIPAERWKFYQEWNHAIFLHWPVDYDELKPFVPNDLQIDCYDGKAWVSLVAFTMEKIRPRYFPAFPPLSDFDEINIRTYVKKDGKNGVYFLSIEGGTRLSCLVAKSISELPYRYSKITRTAAFYYSKNGQYGDKLHLQYEVGDTIETKTQLDKWLTERYALFQESGTSINEFEIHHTEWPLLDIHIKELEINYPRFNALLRNHPAKLHYSTGVQVIAWDKKSSEISTS